MKNHFGYNKINIPFFRHIFYFHITFIKSFQYCQYYGNYNIQFRNKRQQKPLSYDFRNLSPTSLRTPPPSSHQLYYLHSFIVEIVCFYCRADGIKAGLTSKRIILGTIIQQGISDSMKALFGYILFLRATFSFLEIFLTRISSLLS